MSEILLPVLMNKHIPNCHKQLTEYVSTDDFKESLKNGFVVGEFVDLPARDYEWDHFRRIMIDPSAVTVKINKIEFNDRYIVARCEPTVNIGVLLINKITEENHYVAIAPRVICDSNLNISSIIAFDVILSKSSKAKAYLDSVLNCSKWIDCIIPGVTIIKS